MATVKIHGHGYQTVKVLEGIVNAIPGHLNDGVLQHGTLAISATTDRYKTTTELFFRKDGIQHQLAATDDGEFASAYEINSAAAAPLVYGAFLVEATGLITPTITAKAVSSDQVYTTAALAIAALPTVTAGSVAIGYIVVGANISSAWTANTDDLTAGSDCASVSFVNTTINSIADINDTAGADGASAQ